MKKIYTLLLAAFSCLLALQTMLMNKPPCWPAKLPAGVQGRNLQDVQAGLQLAYSLSSKASGNNFAGAPTVFLRI